MRGGKVNNLQIFKNEQFGQIRWLHVNEKDYAVGIDIAKALGYKNANDAVTRHCRGYVKHAVPTGSGEQTMNVIPEGDIYRLTAKSELPSAEKFESWIFDEVLPALRKTGGYVNNEDLFVNTYLQFADDQTKAMFKTTLETVRKQNEIIALKDKEIDHKGAVIIGLVDEVSLAAKRQVLNRVVRYKGANFQERWRELYKQLEMKYHIKLNEQLEKYNLNHKPKLKGKVDYIDKVMNKIPMDV